MKSTSDNEVVVLNLEEQKSQKSGSPILSALQCFCCNYCISSGFSEQAKMCFLAVCSFQRLQDNNLWNTSLQLSFTHSQYAAGLTAGHVTTAELKTQWCSWDFQKEHWLLSVVWTWIVHFFWIPFSYTCFECPIRPSNWLWYTGIFIDLIEPWRVLAL